MLIGALKTPAPEARWTPLLVVTTSAAVFGGCIPLGFQLSVINNPANIILAWCNETVTSGYQVQMTSSQLDILWSAIVSIYLLGGCIASFTGSIVADRFGRKGALIVVNVANTVAAIFFITSRYANSVEMLLLARLLSGAAGGLGYCTVALYLTELGHVTQRGTLGALIRFGFTVGILLGCVLSFENILGNQTSWHFLLSSCQVLTVLSSLALPFIPESPKFLYVFKGDREGCIKALSRLRGLPAESLTKELFDLEESYKVEKANKSKHTMWSVARAPEMRMPLLLVIALEGVMMFSGCNALVFYSSRLMQSVGFSSLISSYVTISLSCVDLFMSALSLATVKLFPRRTLLLTSFTLMVALEVLLTIALKYSDTVTWSAYACIALVLAVTVSSNIGLASIPHFIAAELFVVGPSSVAMVYASLANWTTDFLVALAFPTMEQNLGYLTFTPFIASLAAVAIFTAFYLPETRNRNPKDIAELLKYGFWSKIKEGPQEKLTEIDSYNPAYVEDLAN